jgi:hypothetical protein
MPTLKAHPQLIWQGKRFEWPPHSGWVGNGTAQLREPGKAVLIALSSVKPSAEREQPHLRLRVMTLQGEEFSTSLYVDDFDFLQSLEQELRTCRGLTLDQIGNSTMYLQVGGSVRS